MRWMLRSKIHKARVTLAEPAYVGSISIDEALLERVGLLEGEKVLVVSNTTGERLETYVMLGQRDSGEIGMRGAAARRIGVGEEIIIMGFELSETSLKPSIILVDQHNRYVRDLS